MENYIDLKPKRRSKLRLFFGVRFYRFRTLCKWYFGNEKYASDKAEDRLAYLIYDHHTPILRKLKDVDMWMQHNKAKNLNAAIPNVNRIVIHPGETFSYWKLIGKPTRKKGYVDGMVLNYGSFIAGIGGGLCQLSNMIYWMAIHTPLTIVERYRHSFDVFPDSSRTQPFGSGATCVYNYRDLVIRNETEESYQFVLWMENDQLHGEIRSDVERYMEYQVYEANHKITHEYWGAYIRHNEIRRRVYSSEGKQITDLPVCENHALMMYEPLLTDSF